MVPLIEADAPESSWFTFEDEIGEELLQHLDQVTGPHIMDPTVELRVRFERAPRRPRLLPGRQWGDP